MAKIDVLDTKNKKIKSIDLGEGVFSDKVSNAQIYSVVNWQRAKVRAGTACTKTRAEVKHSTKKPFKQKGTGRARQGMTSSPNLVGGGIVNGPKPRSYDYKLNKKTKYGALRSALSQKLIDGKLKVVESLELSEIKTKEVVNILNAFNATSALMVDEANDKLSKSARNLKNAKYLDVKGLNVLDLLRYEYLIMTEKSLSGLDRLKASK